MNIGSFYSKCLLNNEVDFSLKGVFYLNVFVFYLSQAYIRIKSTEFVPSEISGHKNQLREK